jgi:hypothetical protein
MTNTAAVPDERGLQTVAINDFSPGIYSHSWIVNAGMNPITTAFSPGPFPAPMGAADGNHTHGCMNLATGGLGPLPAMIESHTPQDFSMFTPVGASQSQYLAFYATRWNGDHSTGDEIICLQQYVTSAGVNTVFVDSLKWAAVTNDIVYTSTASGYPPSTLWPVTCCFPFMTMVGPNSPTWTIFQPVVVLPVAINNITAPGFGLRIYPNPAAPTSYGTFGLSVSENIGFAFGHQGRICALPGTGTTWPTGVTLETFAVLSYTDPAGSVTYGNQDEIFGPEDPYGFGGVTSVSAGELFMVKMEGGAVVIQGDLNNPTVTQLPAVQSTGPMYGHVGTDPNGSYYCSMDGGAWVWNGGNASTKISNQIDDSFYQIPNPPPQFFSNGVQVGVRPYGYFCLRWGPWMLFSNNWIYNTLSGGWWRLYDPSVASFFYYTQGFRPHNLYAANPTPATDSTPFAFQFDFESPSNTYTWQSLAIRPSAADRSIDVREVTVRAANTFLDANCQIAVYLVDGSGTAHQAGATWTLSSSTREVQIQNFNIGRQASGWLESIRLRVVATAASAGAPTIFDMTVSYRSREQARVT